MGSYTVKETVQTVNLALSGSVGALPTPPTIFSSFIFKSRGGQVVKSFGS